MSTANIGAPIADQLHVSPSRTESRLSAATGAAPQYPAQSTLSGATRAAVTASVVTSRPAATAAQSESAAELVTQVRSGGTTASAALRKSVLLSGFAVREADGSLTRTVSPGAGIVFQYWEIDALARLADNGVSIRLSQLGDTLAASIPGLANVAVSDLMLDDLRRHGSSSQPEVRFWATFIIELGRQSSHPYDAMANVRPSQVLLDGIQAAFVMKRFARDLQVLDARFRASKVAVGGSSAAAALSQPIEQLTHKDPGLRRGRLFWPSTYEWLVRTLHPFDFMGVATASTGPVSGSSPSLPNCGWTDEVVAPTADEVAVGATWGFGKVMEKLEAAGKAVAGTAATIAGYASGILAYVKLLVTYASMNTVITMKGAGPLKRTKNRTPGERRELEATLAMDTGNLQFVNCARLALNAAGIDFDLPANGPLEGAGVEWVLVEGHQEVDTKGEYSITDPIVEFANSGKRVQEGGVAVDFLSTTTRKDGTATIGILGAGQRTTLPPNVAPVSKQFKVRVNIQVSPPTIRSATGGAAGLLLGGVSGLITLPADLLMRTHWASSKTYTFPLTDWDECNRGAWYGSISYASTKEETIRSTPQQNRVDVVSRSRTRQASFRLNGKAIESAPPGPFFANTRVEATATASTQYTDTGESTLKWQANCSTVSDLVDKLSRHKKGSMTEVGTGSGVREVRILVTHDGEYRIGTSAPDMEVTRRQSSSVEETSTVPGCVPVHSRHFPEEISTFSQDGLDVSIEGRTSPDKLHHLTGSRHTADHLYGDEVTSWDLMRCQ